MQYIVQKDLFKSRHEMMLLYHLKGLGLYYKEMSIPKVTEMADLIEDTPKNVMVFGSVRFAQIAKQFNWTPGSFFNENHDFEVYRKFYGDHLLNNDSIVFPINNRALLGVGYNNSIFARPTLDSKLFTGKVFNSIQWNEMLSKLDSERGLDNLTDKIQICSVKEIYQEYRCWVVKGELITTSLYKLGLRVVYENQDHNENLKNFVKDMISIYQPAEAFVMDVADTPYGYKIIEINAINHAGFYDCNLQKLLMTLEETFTI